MGRFASAATLPLVVLVWACGGDDGSGSPDAAAPADASVVDVDAAPATALSSIAPSSGYYPGGQRVTLDGAGFVGAPVVTIGGRGCGEVTLISATALSCLAPSGAVGAADVVVTTDLGSATAAGAFTYLDFTQVTTVAGTASYGSTNGAGDVAQLSSAINGFHLSGDTLYIADGLSYQVRAMDLASLSPAAPAASAVTLRAVAGTGSAGTDDSTDGTGATATFAQPDDIGAVIGTTLYVSDTDWTGAGTASELRRVDTATGATTTVALGLEDGAGLSALAWDGADSLYVADCNSHAIERVDLTADLATAWAGERGTPGDVVGTLAEARFSCPYGLAFNRDRSVLYVAEDGNNQVKAIDVAAGTVTRLAGAGAAGNADDPSGAAASFRHPEKLVVADRYLFVTDIDNCAIRRIDLETTAVTTVLGDPKSCGHADGPLADAQLGFPVALAYDPRFGLFVGGSDWGWRKADPSGRIQLIH